MDALLKELEANNKRNAEIIREIKVLCSINKNTNEYVPEDYLFKGYTFTVGDMVKITNPSKGQADTGKLIGKTMGGFGRVEIKEGNKGTIRRIPSNLRHVDGTPHKVKDYIKN